MLIAIAIAEEIQGLQISLAVISEIVGNGKVLLFWAWREPEEIVKEYEFMWGTNPKEVLNLVLSKSKKTQKLKNFNAIFCYPWIFSAMAMAMSIYRTLCVLVSFLNSCCCG